MNLMYSIFFGAGVAAWAYSKMGRRLGYGNTKNVFIMVSVIFVLTTIVFFTIITTFLKKS